MRTTSTIKGVLACTALTLTACGGSDGPPTIESFSASPATVEVGGTVELTWETEDADEVSVINLRSGETIATEDDDDGSVRSGPLDRQTSFALVARNAQDQIQQTVVVEIRDAAAPVVDRFVAEPAIVPAGGETTLRWETTGAASVSISDGDTTILTDGDEDGSRAVTLDATATFTLTAIGPDGSSAEATVMVSVDDADAPPLVRSFRAVPNPIVAGDSTTLAWDTVDAVEITIEDGAGAEVITSGDAEGSVDVSPTDTETYRLTASNVQGDTVETVVVTVNAEAGARVDSFSANPSTIRLGESSELTWAVTNADRVLILDGGDVVHTDNAPSGRFEVSPTETTEYTLEAISDAGNADATTTVRISASAPVITRFEASENPIAIGDDVTLTWETLGADRIRVFRDGTLLDTFTDPDGTTTFTVTEAQETLVLEAVNEMGGNTSTILLYGHPMPTIDAFTSTPMTFRDTADVDLTWDVRDVAELELLANGAPVPTFPGVSTTTGVTDSSGTLTVSITETTTFQLVARTLAGEVGATTSVFEEVEETEPNNGPGAATAIPIPGLARGTIQPGSDTDWYAITVPAGGFVRARLSDGSGGCNLDAALQLVASDGATVLTFDNNGGPGRCPAIAPNRDVGARNMPGGTYYVVVLSVGNATGSYVLDVDFGGPGCGNGVLETGEECDDSNPNSGDGCSATCTVESTNTYVAPGPQATISGSIAQLGEQDFFRVDVTSAAIVTFTAFTDAQNSSCNHDSTLTLFDSAQTRVLAQDAGGGVAGCAQLGRRSPAALLQPGTYWLRFGETGNDAIIPAYEIVFDSVAANVCGNGIIEAGETCDDGNTTGGDGCSATCVFGGTEENESGGNENIGAGGVVTLTMDGTYRGSLRAGGDVDVWAVTVPAGSSIDAFVTIGSLTSCPPSALARLSLFDSDGATLLATDTDMGPPANCPRVSPRADPRTVNLDGGTYYLVVQSSRLPPTAVPNYFLQLEIIPPACGNGVLEGNEECDDGNITPNDGCDDQCANEPLNTYTAPGPQAIYTDALPRVGDTDLYRIDVTQPAYVTVALFTLAERSFCSTDSLLTLYASDRTTVVQQNDDSGVGGCSTLAASDPASRLMPGTYYLEVSESGDDRIIPTYDLVFDSAPVDVCGNGRIEGSETCDDFNTVSGDGCDATCSFSGPAENEAGGNDTPTGNGVLVTTSPVVFQGQLTPAGDVDYYAVTVPQGYSLDVFVTVGSFTTCPESPEARLSLFDTDGVTLLATDDDRGPNRNCGRLYPSSSPATVSMAAGTYFIAVREDSMPPQEVQDYFLHVDIVAPACGNAVVEGSEQCDDGNTSGGDGCSAACTAEALDTYVAPGPQLRAGGALAPAFDVDVYRVEVRSTAYLGVTVLTELDRGVCSFDTALELYASDGTLLGTNDDASAGGCPQIDAGDAFARLTPGVYFVRVVGSARDPIVDRYEINFDSIVADVCGNRVQEAGEQCDVGPIASPACSSTCVFTGTTENEMAGNDAFDGAGVQTITTSTIVQGDIVPGGDVDVWAVTASTGYSLSASVFIAGLTSCPETPEARLTVYDTDGATILAQNDDDGPRMNCGRITPDNDRDVVDLPAGRYYIAVDVDGPQAALPNYSLVVDLTPPACGNGIREAVEQCDDGNGISGDGCSTQCMFEAAGTYSAPGAMQVFEGTIAPASEVEAYQVTVTAPTYLFVESFTSLPGQACSADTRVRLFAQDGFTELGEDVDDGLRQCSRIDPNVDGWAQLAPGTYWVTLEDNLRDRQIAAFDLGLMGTPVGQCGNFVTEGAEGCDDGNTASGDGCSATCTVEP